MNPLHIRREDRFAAELCWETCDGLTGLPGRTGIIGHYKADDAEAGTALLRKAQQLCVEQGAIRVIGPMDGSTWQQYRYALDAEGFPSSEAAPPFPLEPAGRPGFVAHFEAAGFRPVAYYQSRLAGDLAQPRSGATALARRIARQGVVVQKLETRQIEQVLVEVWPICRDAFSSAPYYRAIEFQRFREVHLGLLRELPLDFALLARSAPGQLLAFVFAYPSNLEEPAGSASYLVLKTLAVAPDCGTWGVGTHLADEIHRLAHESGFTGVIHALMNEGNASMRISKQFRSVPYRRYALFGWTP